MRISVGTDSLHFINGIYHIDDNGFVSLPVVGKIRIDPMTEKSFVSYLNSAYLQYLRYPTIQVQPLIRVSLLGGFQRPGFFYLSPESSLWDAIAMAGGPVREDGIKKIVWEREGKRRNGTVQPSIEAGSSLETMGVRSGDQFWITHLAKKDGWEIFTTDILPVVSVSVSALSATATIYYIIYQINRGNN